MTVYAVTDSGNGLPTSITVMTPATIASSTSSSSTGTILGVVLGVGLGILVVILLVCNFEDY